MLKKKKKKTQPKYKFYVVKPPQNATIENEDYSSEERFSAAMPTDFYVPFIEEEFFNGYDVEKAIFRMSQKEVLILLFKALGFKPKEIKALLHFKKTQTVYKITHAMRQAYLGEKKD
jgi:hypothetical protein